jgi:uroporphyrinogen-III synthase
VADARIPATTFDSEGLLALPLLADVRGRRVVIFRGDGGREALPEALRSRGAEVDVVACYRRAAPSSVAGLDEAFAAGRIDAVTLTSSEGIDNLWQRLAEGARAAWRRCPSFVPHPRIATHARQLGLAVVETAGGDAGLVAGLLDWAPQRPH